MKPGRIVPTFQRILQVPYSCTLNQPAEGLSEKSAQFFWTMLGHIKKIHPYGFVITVKNGKSYNYLGANNVSQILLY